MKCKYRFRADGKLKPSILAPISVRGWTYEFEANNDGIVTHISVTVNSISKEHWPTMKESQTPGVKAEINIPDVAFPFVKMELRVIEGLLSLYGLREVDFNSVNTEWIPESEEEKQSLSIFSFKRSYQDIPDSKRLATSFDIIARSVIGANLGHDNEVVLSFYRKGRNDIDEQRYIEGIYNFYFMFESAYAQGQFKKAKVTEAFLSSETFTSIIEKAVEDPGQIILGNKELLPKFTQYYQGKPIGEVVERIVELRGFLHHHTSKRKGIWHPEDHEAHELDAIVFQNIAFGIAFNLAGVCVFDSNVTGKYQAMFLGKGR